jgi:cytochrome c-type biogenesis protein CcmE
MKSNRNLIIGAAVVVLCAIVAAGSLIGSTTQAVAFDKLPELKAGERCEVYGVLDERSIRSLKGGNLVQFELVDEKSHQRLKVLYDNQAVSLPANFPAASHARAMGYFDTANGRFTADGVLTKCPSKYDAGSLDLAKQGAVQKWQKATGMKSEGS